MQYLLHLISSIVLILDIFCILAVENNLSWFIPVVAFTVLLLILLAAGGFDYD